MVSCGLLQLAKRPSRWAVGPRSPCLNYHGLVGGGLLNRPHPNDPELFEENKLPGGHRRHLQTLFLCSALDFIKRSISACFLRGPGGEGCSFINKKLTGGGGGLNTTSEGGDRDGGAALTWGSFLKKIHL